MATPRPGPTTTATITATIRPTASSPAISPPILPPPGSAYQARSPAIPDTPTTAEAGFPRVVSESWYGLIAPAGTPPNIVRQIYDAARAALQSPDVIKQIEAQGATAAPNTPDDLRTLIDNEQTKWKRVIEATGAKME